MHIGTNRTVFAAEEKQEPKAYLSIEDAGPDYQFQGEYEGAISDAKTGLQVIARGQGRFQLVAVPGGLPGQGGEVLKNPRPINGLKQADTVSFTRGADTIVIGAGKAIYKTSDGKSFELNRVVRHSPTEGAKPPPGAIVLFDGTSVEAFKSGAAMDERKLLSSLSGGGPTTKQQFRDFTLHVEFLLPFMPDASGQARANSGVYLQGRYEVQVLDSFGRRLANDECGGFYSLATPLVNMNYPPLQWQTYDIDFTAARFDANGNKTAKAAVTIKQNGVLLHDKLELEHSTPGGPKSDGSENSDGPLYLQAHHNPVFYQNVWLLEKKSE